jgi:hypothetical protein
VNTAEIASILDSPPQPPSKEQQMESPIDIQPGSSLANIRLLSTYDDNLPPNIDPDVVMFLGDSAEVLPPLRLEPINDEAKTQGQLRFTLNYTSLRAGFTAIGGLRLYLIEDVGKKNSARLIRKWNTIADVWVRP